MPNKRGKKKALKTKSPKSDALAEQVSRVFERAVALTDRLVAAEKALRQALTSAAGPASPSANARPAAAAKRAPRRPTTAAAPTPAARSASPRAPRKPRAPRAKRSPRTSPAARRTRVTSSPDSAS